MNIKRQPLRLSNYNSTLTRQQARIDANTNDIIIPKPSEYEVGVIKAELPIKDIPLDHIQNPYVFYVDCPLEDHPKFIKGINIFQIDGLYFTIQEFLDKINYVTDILAFPNNLGTFSFDRSTDLISFKCSDPALRVDFNLIFDSRLKNLLEFNDEFYTVNTEFSNFYDVNINIKTQADPFYYQEYDTSNKFFKMKSLLLYSTLPTQKFFEYDQHLSLLYPSNLLFDISLNSENYNKKLSTWTLIPNAFRYFQMNGTRPIENFSIIAVIEFANSSKYNLTIGTDEFMSITLEFQRLNPIVIQADNDV